MEVFVSGNIKIDSVMIPPSKSYAQRAILAATLCKKKTLLKGIGKSDDVLHFLELSKQLGATIDRVENDVYISGGNPILSRQLNAGESGLGIRLIVSVCAVIGGDFEITGKGSLLKRPMTDFEHFLPQLGVNCETNNGFLPIKLSGKGQPGIIELDGSLSSQYLSGLLMALPLLERESKILVSHLQSKPYIDITLSVLAAFGIKISHQNYKHFVIPGNQNYNPEGQYNVEKDYSGASMWMVKGAIKGGITLKGLQPDSVQGDRAMLTALDRAGVKYTWQGNMLVILPSTIQPFSFDATHCPDLFPALVVLAAAARGTTRITGINRLTHKESNRASVLKKEFAKLGLKIERCGDEMIIYGNGKLKSGQIDSNNDHRIAMSGAIAAFLTSEGITITEAESVNKSYPEFWNLFTNLNSN